MEVRAHLKGERYMSKPELKGTYLVFEGGDYIKVRREKRTVDKISPPKKTVYGVKRESGEVEEVYSANTIKQFYVRPPRMIEEEGKEPRMETEGEIAAEEVVKYFEEAKIDKPLLTRIAEKFEKMTALKTIIQMTLKAVQERLAIGYGKAYRDADNRLIPSSKVKKYLVTDVEDGNPVFSEIPVVQRTREFHLTDKYIFSRILLSQFLISDEYELYADNDVDIFKLAKHMESFYDYVRPNGEVIGDAMAVLSPVYLQGGQNIQDYIAFIYPEKRILKDGEEKFVWVMATAQAKRKALKAMDIPKEGEIPLTMSKVPSYRQTDVDTLMASLLAEAED